MYDFALLASLFLFLGACIAYARHPAASFVHPATLYLAFHGFVFVFRPLVARLYDFDFVYRLYGFEPGKMDRVTVLAGASLAMVTFLAVSLRIADGAPVPVPAEEPRRLRRVLAGPILAATALVAPLGIAAQIANWQRRAYDFDSMITDAATGVQANVEGNGWFTDSALMLAPVAVMLVWLARYRGWSWAFFALFAVLQAGTGGRAPIIYALLALAVLYLVENRRRWFDWRVAMLAVVGAVSFQTIVLDRGGMVRELVGGERGSGYVAGRTLDPLEHMDFANMEYFEYIVWAVPARTGSWDYFANNLQIFTEPVPRAIWKDKPYGSPVQHFQLWDYGTPIGMTASIPGMGWMSFGWLGIIVQAGFFAALYGGLYSRLLVRRGGSLERLAYALLIGTAIIVFRDGTLLTFLRLLPFYLGPLVLVWLALRVTRRRTLPLADSSGLAPSAVSLPGPGDRRRALASRAQAPAPRRR